MPDVKQRIIDTVKQSPLAVLSTIDADGRPAARYVTAHIADDLTIRFATFAGSRKVAHIARHPDVHLICGVGSLHTAAGWVQVSGTAEVLTSGEDRRVFWRDAFHAYFQSPDDPNYALVVITPRAIELFNEKSRRPEVWTP